jgi:hypothetical protein
MGSMTILGIAQRERPIKAATSSGIEPRQHQEEACFALPSLQDSL